MDRQPAATLDDPATGRHKAYATGGAISWTVDGRFVRSFRLDRVAGAGGVGPGVEHVVFARFSDGGGGGGAAEVALCLFRVDTLGIHCQSGAAFTIALPFGVRSVHALQVGLLVQRRAADAADAGGLAASLPTLFSLLGPRSEFKMLGLSRAPDLDRMRRQTGRQLMLSPTPARTDGPGAAIPVFNDPDVVLIGTAASRRSPGAQFVLCWDAAARRHVVYQCVIVAAAAAEGEYDDLPGDSGSGTESAASQLSGMGTLSASRPRLARQASMSVQRRSSAAISAAAMASKRKSGYGSAVKSDRRSSMLGRVSFNDSPGPNYAADVFREQRQMRAEAVLQLFWTDRRPRADGRGGDALDARICVVQSVSGADVVCVLNPDSEAVIGLDAASLKEAFRHSARAAAPVSATRAGLDDLLLVSPSGDLLLALGGGCGNSKPIALPGLARAGAVGIRYTEGPWAAVAVAGCSGLELVSTRVRISRLATALAGALSYVLSRAAFPLLWRSIVASLLGVTSAGEELERVSALLLHGSDGGSVPVVLPPRVKSELRDRAAAVLFALQLVHEDAALYRAEPPERLAAVGRLLVCFALQNGQLCAYQALLRAGHPPPSHDALPLQSSRQRVGDSGPAVLPCLARWALATLDVGGARPAPFPMLPSITGLFGIDDAEPAHAAAAALNLLGATADVIYQLAAGRDAALVLRRLAGDEAPALLVQQLAPDVQWLVAAAAERLQQLCLQSWPPNVLALLGRQDIPANAAGVVASGASSGGAGPLTQPPDAMDVVELCDGVLGHPALPGQPGGAGARQSAESHEFGLLAFGRDLRVDEAERLLDSSGTTHTASAAPDDEGDGGAKEPYLAALAQRVLALAPGQALLRFSTRDLNAQDALAISPPAVRAQFRGQKTAAVWDPADADVRWPLFHSGVAAALALERDQLRQAHPSWVLLNWPAEPAPDAADASAEHRAFGRALASHAGFLLGMGLLSHDASPPADGGASPAGRPPRNGPLCNMPPWQAFKYLSRRDGLTSIALLLGCACAHRGSMNGPVNKILSLHIPNLLPPGSSELMLLSYGTQAAAMLGLGLLFMRSQNRRMVEVMLHELSSVACTAHGAAADRLDAASGDPAESSPECYSLAAGFALGLVALGRGMSARTLADLHLLDSLSAAMGGTAGAAHPQEHAAAAGSAVSDLGATAAIGLVFLGTGYGPAAQRLALPQMLQHLRTADPFSVLWRVLMRSLIMLDDVEPTAAWVESNLPRACTPSGRPELPPDLCRVRLHVVTAACFAVALKHVGSEDPRAHAVTLAYFDELEAIVARPALGYEASLTRAAAQSCLDAVAVAAALVMAGSGDVATMRRLRALHSATAARSYGNHMASHMALGILFLGGGARFTIARSPESMALLLVALFPRFPQHFGDNHEHLQAWRPLWALCVVPRCLVVRDVRSGAMCRDAAVTLAGLTADGARWSSTVVPPVPFPSLAGVQTASVAAPGYLPVCVDLSPRSYARRLLLRRRVLYMQSSALSFPIDAAPGPPPLLRYQRWLADTEARVDNVCALLARASDEGPAHIPDLAAAVRAIGRLRLCARAPRCALLAGGRGSGRTGRWAEDTYLAWLRVRRRVLELGQTTIARRLLVEYWTADQLPDAAPGVAPVVAVLHAALDLPGPSDAAELAKQIPLAQLADHLLHCDPVCQ